MNDSAKKPAPQCGCSTGQTPSHIACPVCRKMGTTVKSVTPQHTIRKSALSGFDTKLDYHFCENPECDVAYYNMQNTSVFTVEDLKNRVTVKDASPETPLCYCFKVLKRHALEEIARTGTTNVYQTIQEKMKPGQSCFCEKANPRGDTCMKDIEAWLDIQGITRESNFPPDTQSGGNCCGGQAEPGSSGSGCCT